jgi:adenylate kinase
LEEWRNEKKAEEEKRTSKEVQQEQEVVACAALVFAAYSAAPFSIVDFQGNKPFLRN